MAVPADGLVSHACYAALTIAVSYNVRPLADGESMPVDTHEVLLIRGPAIAARLGHDWDEMVEEVAARYLVTTPDWTPFFATQGWVPWTLQCTALGLRRIDARRALPLTTSFVSLCSSRSCTDGHVRNFVCAAAHMIGRAADISRSLVCEVNFPAPPPPPPPNLLLSSWDVFPRTPPHRVCVGPGGAHRTCLCGNAQHTGR